MPFHFSNQVLKNMTNKKIEIRYFYKFKFLILNSKYNNIFNGLMLTTLLSTYTHTSVKKKVIHKKVH